MKDVIMKKMEGVKLVKSYLDKYLFCQAKNWQIILMVIVGLGVLCLHLSYEYRFFRKNFTLAKFDCGDKYKLIIDVEEKLVGNYYLYCTIKKNRKECIPRRLFWDFCSKSIRNTFEMITTEDGQYTGIVSIYKPETLYIVFHKKSEKLWTRNQNDFKDKDFHTFIEELKKHSPDSLD